MGKDKAGSSNRGGAASGARQRPQTVSSVRKSSGVALPSVTKAAAPKKAGGSAPPSSPSTISSERIGEIAGDVWQLLADRGEQSPASLKRSIDAPGDVVMAAVGWLAREEKLAFVMTGRAVKLSLR